HFSLYRYIEDYQGYLQMRPMVMVEDKRHPEFEKEIISRVENIFSSRYEKVLLRPTEQELLMDYRKTIAEKKLGPKNLPTNHEIAQKTGRPYATVKTYNHRILEKMKPAYPLKGYRTVAELAYLMEWAFGDLS
ncbi:MAG: hypothetical protein AAFQ37_02535, partial [Bacteroidota bacterium]